VISKTFRLPAGSTQFEVDLVNRLDAILKEFADLVNTTETDLNTAESDIDTLQGEASLEAATGIVNAFSDGGNSVVMGSLADAGKAIASGELAATVYKDILTVTDSGVLTLCAAITADGTARTVGLKITIDGTIVFDAVTNSVSATNSGIVGVGAYFGATTSGSGWVSGWVPFNTSLVVSVKSSLDETDKITTYVAYHTT
jgi:hypothetical protein